MCISIRQPFWEILFCMTYGMLFLPALASSLLDGLSTARGPMQQAESNGDPWRFILPVLRRRLRIWIRFWAAAFGSFFVLYCILILDIGQGWVISIVRLLWMGSWEMEPLGLVRLPLDYSADPHGLYFIFGDGLALTTEWTVLLLVSLILWSPHCSRAWMLVLAAFVTAAIVHLWLTGFVHLYVPEAWRTANYQMPRDTLREFIGSGELVAYSYMVPVRHIAMAVFSLPIIAGMGALVYRDPKGLFHLGETPLKK